MNPRFFARSTGRVIWLMLDTQHAPFPIRKIDLNGKTQTEYEVALAGTMRVATEMTHLLSQLPRG